VTIFSFSDLNLLPVACPSLMQGDMLRECVSDADCESDQQCCPARSSAAAHDKYCTTAYGLDINDISE